MSDIAGGNFAADDGTGYDFSSVNNRRDDDDVETAINAELEEELGVAGLLVAKAKIFSDKNGANVKVAD